MISILDMFKIGIGPSSSHTVGPMKAALAFRDTLLAHPSFDLVERIQVHLYGSLSLTGKGHGTDHATIAGLMGFAPETVDSAALPGRIQQTISDQYLAMGRERLLRFDYGKDIVFHREALAEHENGMRFEAWTRKEKIHSETWFSIGGGFVVPAQEFSADQECEAAMDVPYPYRHAKDILAHCKRENLRFSTLMLRNEVALHGEAEVHEYCQKIWAVMTSCIAHGLNNEGVLPGGLNIPRRAPALQARLKSSEKMSKDPMRIVDWVNMIAFAVNEENAAGGRVVTAPTNGACGIVPAVLAYYERFIGRLDEDTITRYLLVCSGVASLYKLNASISGAEVGCQGEVGVACSMAAAGLTDIKGGSITQACEAAEIAMEHHLGLTCDPIAGLVQVPCIERNGMSAVKAINASRMALLRTTSGVVSLDDVIRTMFETGKDMSQKYRETATGGLATHVQC